MSLGSKLRQARIDKGYTLNSLQQMTKIQKKYLQSMEENNWDDMPSTFYVKAFIKQYADVVGLDGEALIQEYDQELNLTEGSEAFFRQTEPEEALPSRLELTGNDKKDPVEIALSYLPLLLLIAIILGIMVTLILAIQNISSMDQAEESSSQEISIVSSISPESVTSSQGSDDGQTDEAIEDSEGSLADNQQIVGGTIMTLVSEVGAPPVYQLNRPLSDLEFTVEATGFVWLGVFEEGSMVIDTTLNEGEDLTYQAEPGSQELRLSLGYPEGAVFFIEGEALDLPEDSYNDTVLFISEEVGQASSDLDPDTDTSGESGPAGEETSSGYQGPAVFAPEGDGD